MEWWLEWLCPKQWECLLHDFALLLHIVLYMYQQMKDKKIFLERKRQRNKKSRRPFIPVPLSIFHQQLTSPLVAAETSQSQSHRASAAAAAVSHGGGVASGEASARAERPAVRGRRRRAGPVDDAAGVHPHPDAVQGPQARLRRRYPLFLHKLELIASLLILFLELFLCVPYLHAC